MKMGGGVWERDTIERVGVISKRKSFLMVGKY